MKFLLLGGTGFLGEAFARSRPASDQIFMLGRTPPKYDCEAEVTHVTCDLSKFDELRSVLDALEKRLAGDPVDCIVHLAVSRLHRGFPDTALDMFAVNTASTAALLDFAHRMKVERFVLGSTGSVYNPPWGEKADEGLLSYPKSYFAASKSFADILASFYQDFMKLSILRFYVPYGPGLESRMLNDIINRVKTETPIRISEDGRALTFSPIYSDDAVHIIDTAVSEGWQGVFNVGSGEEVDLITVAKLAGKHFGKEPLIERDPSIQALYLVPETTKLAEVLSSYKFRSFESGFAEMLSTS